MVTFYNTNEVTLKRAYFNKLKSMLESEGTPIQQNIGKTVDSLYFEFANGMSLTTEICGGQNNYYDNVFMNNKDNYEVINFDCSYTLSEQTEYKYNGDTYITNITLLGVNNV